MNDDQAPKKELMVSIKLSELEALQKKIIELEFKVLTWLKLQTDVNSSTANFTQETQKAMARFDETIKNMLQTMEIHQYILSGGDQAAHEENALDLELPDINLIDKKLLN